MRGPQSAEDTPTVRKRMSTKQKIGRNEPCPCGSGKKYKVCCGSPVSAPSQDFVATAQDGETLYVYGSNMLTNRVDREASVIAKDFDQLCRDYLADIDEVYSCAMSLLHHGLTQARKHNDETRCALATVLTNALKSFTAAYALLRTGWRLQPYLCIRNAFEALSVAIHVAMTPQDFERFKRGELDSTRTFNSAKKLMPIFGRVYGDMSHQFVHVGKPFRHIQQGSKYQKNEKDLWGCLFVLMSLIWFTYEVVEFIFYDFARDPIFWKRIGDNEYRLALTAQAKDWKARLIARYKQHPEAFPAH
jgi:hypothetical protein